MDIESDLEQVRLFGTVKWFSASKGYGFIVTEGVTNDILLHVNVLRSFGQNSVVDGAQIEFIASRTARGIQATQVLSLGGVSPVAQLADVLELSPEELEALPLEAARVKWFDRSKGFGFANSFGQSDDIFVHVEVVRQSGLSELLPGEAICLKTVSGARGRMAVALLGWDAAQRSV